MAFNFDVFKRALGDVSAQLKNMRASRELAMRQREDLQSLPLAKSDYLATLDAWIDRQSAGFAQRLETGSAHYRRNPLTAVPEDTKAPCPPIRILTATKNPEDTATPIGVEFNLYALLGPQIKTALRNIVNEMNFDGAGPPRAERLQMIAALDARIDAIDKQEQELIEQAGAAGVKL